jgi:hypothetical protein
MPTVARNVAEQVVQAVEVAYSADPANLESTDVVVALGPAVRVIDFIHTVQARELVVVAFADSAMTMTIDLVSYMGIPDFTAATIALLPGLTTITVVTGLLTGARVSAALVAGAPGIIRAAAYARS